ncbi:MAG: hypothetical protein R3353_00940 [Salegentibacter mishustinae]|nr:hypothetical protein [Salegentibacter mishustinae]
MQNIENHSIFGNYSTDENRVTAALLQILKLGGTEFIMEVFSRVKDIAFPSNEIIIKTQKKENANVYDGLIECNFSFKFLIESKLNGVIDEKQLQGLIENANLAQNFILYLTPDNNLPLSLTDKAPNLYWTNWKRINEILKELNPNTEPLNFLICEFEKYLKNLRLLDVVAPEEKVQIAAGSWGEPIALEYRFYACQNNRSVQDSKYLAFYNRAGIHSLFEIVKGPINDVDLSTIDTPEMKSYLSKHEPNFKGDLRQLYNLRLVRNDLKIKNNIKDKNGNNSAYTMGVFRYTSLEKLKLAKTTSDL